MDARSGVDVSTLRDVMKKLVYPNGDTVDIVLEWKADTPEYAFQQVTRLGKSYSKKFGKVCGDVDYPDLQGDWSVDVFFETGSKDRLKSWEASVKWMPRAHKPLQFSDRLMGLPPYDRWKIQIGHNEGGLVHIQPSRSHFAPWILKFENDSICHWSSKERYSRGNFGFVFGSDHIKITVKVPEISRGRPYEIMLAEARRLLQPYSFRYGEYHYAAGKMEEAPDYTIRLEEDQTIAVKRAELSNASPVFARFFEQNNFKENVLGIYDLSDSDTQTNGFDIHDFVLFCCTGKIYPKTMNNMVEDMASLADMYQVPGLVRLCEILMVAEVENYLDKSAEFWQRKLRVATLLKLDLVLIAVHLVQKERCEKWTKSMPESWFRYLAENPDLVVETYKALADLAA